MKALKEMKGRKALGLDGLQTCFLNKYWNVLGPKIVSMTLGILNDGNDISVIMILTSF